MTEDGLPGGSKKSSIAEEIPPGFWENPLPIFPIRRRFLSGPLPPGIMVIEKMKWSQRIARLVDQDFIARALSRSKKLFTILFRKKFERWCPGLGWFCPTREVPCPGLSLRSN